MKSAFGSISKFLTAEEVPRWFGLSIVLIYLVGLGAVARYGISEAQRTSAGQSNEHIQYAADALVRELGWALRGAQNQEDSAPSVRIAMRRFTHQFTEAKVNVYDASGNGLFSSAGIATKPLSNPAGYLDLPTGTANPITMEDVNIFHGRVVLANTDGSASNWPQALIEIHVPVPEPKSPFANVAGLVIVVFIVLGALFVVYRCLREQLRNVSRIADRLRSQDEIRDDLHSLRIIDEQDTAATTWNQLVDLAQNSLDLDHRKEADAELSRVLAESSGGVLSDALHAVPEGMVLVTEEDNVEYANESACRMFDWELERVKENTVADMPKSGIGEAVGNLLKSALQPEGQFLPCNEVITLEDENDSEPSVYRAWIMPIHRARHQGDCLIMIRDITQQSRTDRAREDLIAQVTHELRTPLTNIRAYSETLSSGMFDDPKLVAECYNVINKETRRLSRLIEDMLNVSQLEVGSIELQMDQVDLKTVLADAVQDIRGIADEKQIEVQLLLPPKIETIRADRDKLAVVVNNLLGNAIKYTPEEGHVIIGCQITSDDATITVKDNGVGISEEDQAKIFEKFYRAADDEVQSVTGTGIGLYTAREIARRHGGDIELISSKGEGSTFMVKLPHQGTRATNLSSADSTQES